MADFVVTDKDLETSIDRAADSFLIYDNSASKLVRTSVNYALDLTGHPVGTTDIQTLTNKTLTSPSISSPVLSGTITGTYTIGGTPTFPASVVTLTGSQTITNKVLTSPTINDATIANPTLTVDTISEYTTDNGVVIENVTFKDGGFTANTITSTGNADLKTVITDTISEKTSAAGVTIDGLKIKDGLIAQTGLPTNAITLGYAQSTTNQAYISTETDLTGLSVAVTVPTGGRAVKITGCIAGINGTVAGDRAHVHIKEGTTDYQVSGIIVASLGQTMFVQVYLPAAIATAGSHTYKLSLERSNGTGTLSTNSSSINVSYILVELI